MSSPWFVHSQPTGGKGPALPEQRAAGRARVVSPNDCSTVETLLSPALGVDCQPCSQNLWRGGIAVTAVKWTCFYDHSLRTSPTFLPGVPFKEFYDVLCLNSVYRINLWKSFSFPSPDRNGVFPWSEPSSASSWACHNPKTAGWPKRSVTNPMNYHSNAWQPVEAEFVQKFKPSAWFPKASALQTVPAS